MKVLIALLSLVISVSGFKTEFNKGDDPKTDASRFGKAIQSTLSGRSDEKFIDYLAKDFSFTKCSFSLTKDQTVQLFESYYPSGKIDFTIDIVSAIRSGDGRLIINAVLDGAGMKSAVEIVAQPYKSLKGKYQIESMKTTENCQRRKKKNVELK